jgi:hypothetical protein
MTRENFIKHYGETKIKEVSGILHNYLISNSMENHISLEKKIIQYGVLKVKDTINNFDDLLEFEEN